MKKAVPTLPGTLADYIIDNARMIDDLTAILGDEGDFAIGVRGLYASEKRIKKSWVWRDGKHTNKRLPGTSCIGIAADWEYTSRHEILQKLKLDLRNTTQYGDGEYAIIKGQYNRNIQDQYAEDMGEYILMGAEIVAYLNGGDKK